MMTESAFSIEELEELYCLFKVEELQACHLVISKTFEQNCHVTYKSKETDAAAEIKSHCSQSGV